jgi:subtilisin family serine protease
VHAQTGARGLRRFGRLEQVRLAAGMDVETMRRWYASRSDVEYAEPNYLARKAAEPNDPLFEDQWALRNTGQRVNGVRGTPGADINATAAWDRHTGDASVVIAIIDSGIDHSHPDLAANIWANPDDSANGLDDDGNGYIDDVRGWNFVGNNADPMDDDADRHGTLVASISGAAGDNGIGISGVNWRVSLMALKVLDAEGSGATSDIVAAIDYAIDQGVAVINASYSYGCGTDIVLSERDAVARARAAGILLVAAAGNEDCDLDSQPSYPASHAYNNVIAVGASNSFDQRAIFGSGASNYGAHSVHVFAPGLNVLAAGADHDYLYASGTSMSAPLVSGAAALLKAWRPELSMLRVREILLASAHNLTALEGLAVTGARLDIGAAMDFDLAANPPLRPSHLGAAKVSDSRVDLTWLDDSSVETGYRLEYRAAPDAAYTTQATLAANATSYQDTSVAAGEGSYNGYRMRAFNAVGDSAPTAEVTVLTPPLPPSNLRGSGSGGDFTLNWDDHSARETGYALERAAGAGDFGAIAALPANSTAYVDAGLTLGVNYRYRVKALSDLAGDSTYASTLSYTPSSSTQTVGDSGGGGGGGGCFIATAAYGSYLHPKVNVLRSLRDRYLLTNTPGRWFVAAYYRASPPLADFIARHDGLRAAVRVLLAPLVWLAEQLLPTAQAGDLFRRMLPGETQVAEDVTASLKAERRLLVKFRPGVERTEALELLRGLGGNHLKTLHAAAGADGALDLAEFATLAERDAALLRLRQDARVAYAEADQVVSRPRLP